MKKRERNYTLGEIAARLLKMAAPQKKLIILSTLVSIIGNIAQMGLMGCGAALILFCAGHLEAGTWQLWGGLTLLSAILIGVMRFFEGYYSHVAAYKLLADMRVRLYEALRRLAPACLVDRKKGDIISVAIADLDTIENFFAHTIGPMFTVVLLPLISLCYAGSVHWLFAATLFPIYLMISVVIPLLAMKTGRSLGEDYRGKLGEIKNYILESVYGLKDIQIFGVGDERMASVEEQSQSINRTAHAMTLHRQLVTAMPTFFIYLSRILIILVAGYLALSGQKELSGVIILSFVVSASFSSTQSLISVVSSLLEAFASADRYFELEDALPAIAEDETPCPVEHIEDICFEDMSFSYGVEKDKTILKDVRLTLRHGDRLGIVGESGAGKSTILRLLLRFWDPTKGKITLDGTDLKRVKLKDLRSRIAMLEQQTFIYNDTVAANIALGKPNASREEIIEAARRAGIHSTISRLPDGYDTAMGELGNRLSGGEKQRVGIARIMLTDPDIIVMDEPTSSLDVFSEKLMLKTLDEQYADKTLIIVSHRNSTLTGCDMIYRLNAGSLQSVEVV